MLHSEQLESFEVFVLFCCKIGQSHNLLLTPPSPLHHSEIVSQCSYHLKHTDF